MWLPTADFESAASAIPPYLLNVDRGDRVSGATLQSSYHIPTSVSRNDSLIRTVAKSPIFSYH